MAFRGKVCRRFEFRPLGPSAAARNGEPRGAAVALGQELHQNYIAGLITRTSRGGFTSLRGEDPAMLKDIVESLYAEQPQTLLYHYTSLAGLQGIVTSRKQWASELRYMNDGQELRQFVQHLDREIHKRLDAASGQADVLTQFRAFALARVATGPMLFAISFTEQGNLLSQWRGYCPHGRGVSLGFTAERIIATAKAGGFSVGRCIYDAEHQSELAARVIDAALTTAEALGPDAAAEPLHSYYRAFLSIENDIIKISALVKNESFREEAEWRLVSEAFPRDAQAHVEYREGMSTLIPYIELPHLDRTPLFDHVYLGPTPSGHLSMEALSKYLAKTQAAHELENSMTPLRIT